ncbi:conserved hypothetical protein [Cyanobium sp. PCC 7001]|uniref:DUF554 family protein n=1 Tax=Cyanobium sp. PCC 7001 TaxID=180281 RepID=UPI0001804EBA|nr:DUF554 family protein [Cyanobium sp. PCC 7001]EDY37665.1 conserved hypothetical protein [Cyanobium sp. PCC 7001]
MAFWAATSGTWINLLTVLLGGGLGAALGRRLKPQLTRQWQQWLGVVTLLLAIEMVQPLWQLRLGPFPAVLAALLVVMLGGALGHGLALERRLDGWLRRLGQAHREGDGQLQESSRPQRHAAEVVSGAFVLFCIGPMTLLGCLRNGALGDPDLLLVKAGLDGLSAAVFAAAVGLVLLWVLLPLGVLQFALSGAGALAASGFSDPSGSPVVLFTAAVGGILVLALALDLLELPHPSVVNGLVALGLAPALGWAMQP